jgi:hypothetical protein
MVMELGYLMKNKRIMYIFYKNMNLWAYEQHLMEKDKYSI